MLSNISIIIIGAGSYGTALAITLARHGHNVLLWGRNLAHMQALKVMRCNQVFLPNVYFPPTLHLEVSLPKVLNSSRDILIVVPSNAFKNILIQIKPFLKNNARIVWATKGLEEKTGRLLQEVAREILGNDIPLAVLSGPTFACDLAKGLPTAITLASTDVQFSYDLQKLLHCGKSFRVYNNSDLIGVQLGGAVKNVIAIGAGISDGIGFGANARTALITRGIAEISRLGVAMGAESKTFMGMAGLGDLVLTCTDNQSRNRRFGVLLGKGFSVKSAQDQIGQVVEGYNNIKEVLELANRYHVEMPITEQIYHVIFLNKNIHQAALALLGRTRKDEIVSG